MRTPERRKFVQELLAILMSTPGLEHDKVGPLLERMLGPVIDRQLKGKSRIDPLYDFGFVLHEMIEEFNSTNTTLER